MCARMTVLICVAALLVGCAAFEGGTAKTAPPADKGTLELTVNVRNVQVFVDGSLYGMVKRADRPQLIVIPAGTHEMTMKKFGYEDFTVKIGVEAGAINTLVVDMKRLPTEAVEVPEGERKVPAAVRD